MPDREKVINKVKAIVADMQEEVDEWKDYSDSELRGGLTCDCDWWYKTLQTLKDAIALLKEQEPRVLGLDEFHREMAVWLEDVDKEDVVLAIGGSSCGGAKCFITEYDLGVSALDSEYGIRWRAWTAKPTIKMRKAVKWDG